MKSQKPGDACVCQVEHSANAGDDGDDGEDDDSKLFIRKCIELTITFVFYRYIF